MTSCVWGKEAPLGTGSNFDVFWKPSKASICPHLVLLFLIRAIITSILSTCMEGAMVLIINLLVIAVIYFVPKYGRERVPMLVSYVIMQ